VSVCPTNIGLHDLTGTRKLYLRYSLHFSQDLLELCEYVASLNLFLGKGTIYIRAHILTDLHTYILIYINKYIHTHCNTYIHNTCIYTYVHTHAYIHAYTLTYMNTYVHTHMHTYLRTHIHRYIFITYIYS